MVNADDILKIESLNGLNEKFKKILNINENESFIKKEYLNYKDRLDHELEIIIQDEIFKLFFNCF